ncbi:MAG: hypothetical protein MGG11_05020 [Trichodesmium sp. MAG_R03]|nr:hypothetical protein [Trichodesmium sp. MAG_R03]
MKTQNSRIQAIICEIDEVLSQPSTESSHKITQEILRKSQQVLQETLEFLNQDLDNSSNLQLPSVDPCLASEDTINLQIKQSLKEVFFTPINQYLQEDLTILKEQQRALREEIRQLEKQRQENYSLAQQYAKQEQIIFEFSQVLLSQIQEIFAEHVSHLATQYLSPPQSVLSSKQNISPQTMEDVETSEAMQVSEGKLEETYKFDQSFIDYSNHDDSKLVLPYPGYEFSEIGDTESKTTETEKKKWQPERLNNQQYSLDDQSSIDERQGLETLEYLSDIFGTPDIDKGTTNQVITTTKNQQNITLKDKLEEEIYIQASITQNLLPVEELDKKPKEFLLSSKTLQCLRSDLESLEEIEVDELMDDLEKTQLQLRKEENEDEREKPPQCDVAQKDDLTNLEDLEKSIGNEEKNNSILPENSENKLTLENILDNLTPETDEERIETDNQELLSLEALLQD